MVKVNLNDTAELIFQKSDTAFLPSLEGIKEDLKMIAQDHEDLIEETGESFVYEVDLKNVIQYFVKDKEIAEKIFKESVILTGDKFIAQAVVALKDALVIGDEEKVLNFLEDLFEESPISRWTVERLIKG